MFSTSELLRGVCDMARPTASNSIWNLPPNFALAWISSVVAANAWLPDGSKIAKMHYNPVKSTDSPDQTTELPGALQNVDFIEKDSKRFTDSDGGGWGYTAFEYNDASDTFTPATENDTPPQSNDAKCGVACHVIAQSKDYIFTEYKKR